MHMRMNVCMCERDQTQACSHVCVLTNKYPSQQYAENKVKKQANLKPQATLLETVEVRVKPWVQISMRRAQSAAYRQFKGFIAQRHTEI